MDYQKSDIAGKKFIFKLLKKNGAPSIINSFNLPIVYVGSYSIPNIAIINERDPKTGLMQQKTIRYIPGEPSIYKDKQSDDRDVPKKKHKITFINGRKTVEADNDPLLLEFMMKCNQNSTNPNRRTAVRAEFELEDTALAISKDIAKDKLISEVTNWCWTGDWDEVGAYARVLNVDLLQTPDEVRHNLKVIALRDPLKFVNEKKNPSMRKKHHVLEAIDRGYLLVDPATNSIAWTNNPHKPIAVAAIGMSPVDVLVNKLSTDEGDVLYHTLVNLITPEPVMVTTEMYVPSAEELQAMKGANVVVQEPIPAVVESDSELMDIAVQAEQIGLLKFTPPIWYNYRGLNYKKKEGFVEAMKKAPSILKNIRYDINKAQKVV